jgi:hypothetical protein
LLVSGCHSTKIAESYGFIVTTEKKGLIRIEGKAVNAKGGACVETKENKIYYISNKDSWKERVLYKSVRVSGRIVVISNELKDPTRMVPYIKRKVIIKQAITRILKDM